MPDDHTTAPLSRIVLASNNAGKLREFTALFSTVGIEIVPGLAVPEAEEPFGTFIENALTKARHASRSPGSRRSPTIRGRAGRLFGTRAARGREATRRTTRISSSSCAATTGAHTIAACSLAPCGRPRAAVRRGRWAGEIVARRAARIGYDPYFYLPSLGATAAEPAVKNTHSIARLKALLARLAEEEHA